MTSESESSKNELESESGLEYYKSGTALPMFFLIYDKPVT